MYKNAICKIIKKALALECLPIENNLANIQKIPYEIIKIETNDNPAWSIKVSSLFLTQTNQHVIKAKLGDNFSENHLAWTAEQVSEDGHFLYAGIFQLGGLLSCVADLYFETSCLPADNPIVESQFSNLDPIMDAVVMWYCSYVNGDWEHSFGIKLDLVSGYVSMWKHEAIPYWRLTISLEETDLEEHCITYRRPEDIKSQKIIDWCHVWVEDKKFNGACGVQNLQEVLRHFVRFAAQHEPQYADLLLGTGINYNLGEIRKNNIS